MHILRTHPYITTLVGALLSGASFLIPELWVAAVIGLCLFFTSIVHAPTYRVALYCGVWFSLIVSGAGIWWFWDTLPFDWLGVPFVAGAYGVFVGWLLTTLALALPIAFGAWMLYIFRTNQFFPILAAGVWVAVEELRAWSFALLNLGTESLLGPHFSIASLGYALAEYPYTLSFAQYGGIHTLNGVLALLAGSLAILLYRPRNVVAGVLIIGTLLIPLGISPTVPYSEHPVTVSVLTTDTALYAQPDTETLEALIASASEEAPDVLVLPEGQRWDPQYWDFFTNEVLVLHTLHSRRGEHTYDSLVYETQEGVLATYDKMFLMPFGEYAPAFPTVLVSLFPNQHLQQYLKNLFGKLSRGSALPVVSYNGRIFGGLICSDSLSPLLYGSLATQGADVFINVANPAWFHGSTLMQNRTLVSARVHAIAHHAYFIAAMNGVPSFVIDPTGTVIRTGSARPNVFTVRIP